MKRQTAIVRVGRALGCVVKPWTGLFVVGEARRWTLRGRNVRAPGRREGGGAVEWQWRSEEDSSALGGRYCTVVCGVVPVHVHVHVHVECSCVTL